MKLDVIIPVCDEAGTIEELVGRVVAVGLCNKIIIVDDGSTDGTRALLAEISGPNITVLYHEHNRGKTAAIRTGLAEVSGDVVIIQDADLEYDPQDYRQIMRAFAEHPDADAVFGTRYANESVALFWLYWSVNKVMGKPGVRTSRFLINRRSLANQTSHFLRDLRGGRGNAHNRRSKFKFYDSINLANFYGTQFLTFLANVLYGLELTDEATCYKAIRADLLRSMRLTTEGFNFCPEVTAKLGRERRKIVEVPINYSPRKVYEGKKIRLRDGVTAIRTLFELRFK